MCLYQCLLFGKALVYLLVARHAIGGIELSNVRELAGCGASGISLSGAIVRAGDPEKAARALINEINKYFG